MAETAIELANVSVTVNRVSLLKNVSAGIPKGKITALIGPNGAGKTTLVLAILGVIPYEGEIFFIRKGRRETTRPRIGYVPQRLDFDRGLPLTVLDFLTLSSQRRPLWLGYQQAKRDKALEALREIGVEHLRERQIGRLSGGELQRVMLAMAISRDPEILLLDEPAAGVDVSGEVLFCEFMTRVQREGHLTMMIVSHDLSIVTGHAEHVICLNRTVQCQGGAPEVLTPENIMAVYGPHAGLYRHGKDTRPGASATCIHPLHHK
ncbi:MAG TPA: metal ABC transporter ATP-binding protein [Proteobacteria bacterium]|nr:metal ABC transporter ATP-binding protein [Pseudomonadota bacterium]